MMPAIGIDLGTSYSCVGVWQRGKVEIIPNDQGNAVTPSYVAFTENERLVGDAAVSQMSADPANTIFDVKRMIGLRYDDPRIRDRARHWTFRVVEEGSKPKICVEAYSEVESFYPEEICSMILRKMRKTAEARFREEIRDAVITVPACFNDRQRRLTKEAGARAGLNVLRVMNEPTAAALAYGLNGNVAGAKNVLIFDLGGGTCDASVLSIEEGSLFEVKATAGDTNLGGEDFDTRLVEYLAQEFERKHRKSLRHHPRSLLRLRTAAERAKRKLSSSAEATIEVDTLCDGVDFRAKVTRARFVELCADLFEAAVRLVEKALLEAKMDKEFVHDVVLVGGSTRIPKIRSLLEEYFCGKRLNLSVNPDEAVAAGAAMQAAMLTRREIDRSELQDVLLVDITPLSLGIETVGGAMTRVITRNASIPCTQTQTFTTNGDNQPGITIRVFEGEGAMVRENDLLGTFQLGGITLAPRGVPKISVTFDVDANGILDVTATDNANGARNNIKIARIAEQLKHQDADRYMREDNEKRDDFTAKNELEGYVLFVKQAIRSGKFPFREQDEDLMNCLCEDTLDWIIRNPVADKCEYQMKREALQQRYSMILVKLDHLSSNSRKRIKF